MVTEAKQGKKYWTFHRTNGFEQKGMRQWKALSLISFSLSSSQLHCFLSFFLPVSLSLRLFITFIDPNRALGALIFKGILFVMFMSYPQPGEDLKWKRAPSLPMQELTRRFGAGRKTGTRDSGRESSFSSASGQRRPGTGSHHRTRPVPPLPHHEKPLQFAPEVSVLGH